ncbi:MAG: helix-turn-helix transcriptional regulator [Austwickia sp.]|nr:helix-turn-helix transcriptional regulator [Austwickia sp.]MBK8437839.1 helix-turn-helix transcriptional regulator [Austwickia sp.]MBK9100146.1 helix-turn-helix transcriptional regulator [Austwickia sp.]
MGQGTAGHRDVLTDEPDVCRPPGTRPILDHTSAAEVADLLKAIADPVRLRLLTHIGAAPGTTVCACHLTEPLGISQPTLSHHLKKLIDAGLITRERRGRWAHYTLVADRLEQALAPLAGLDAPARRRP